MVKENPGDQWSEDDVTDLVVNPIYMMGSSPMINVDTWIKAQGELLGALGNEQYFRKLARVLNATFGEFVS